MKSRAKGDGGVLVIDTKGQFGEVELTMKDTWHLSADGQTLTRRRHLSSAGGEVDQKVVFRKAVGDS